MGLHRKFRRFAAITIISVAATMALSGAEAVKPPLVLPSVVDWSTPQTKAAIPDGLKYDLMTVVKDKPSALLIAMARQARDEGRFADAVFILQSALDSSYGISMFQQYLKEALAATNQRMNQESRPVLYEKGFKASKDTKVDVLLVSLMEAQKSAAMGTQRVRIEVRSLLADAFSEKWRWVLLQRSVAIFKEEIKKRMPLNNLEFSSNHQQYFMEGHFNSEYPAVVPETNLELGLLFKDTQDYVLARHHLEAVLEQRAFLSVAEREYQARYALAEIAVVQGRMYDYEKILKDLCAKDRDFISQESAVANRRTQMVDVLLSDPAGLDRVIQLYRLTDDFSLRAHRQLGAMYLQRRNFEQALPHLIFAVLKPASRAMQEIRDRQYGYAYTTLADFLATARQYPDIMDYLSDSGFYDSLFCLSDTVMGYKPNYLRLPRQLWTVLAATPEAGVIQPQAKEFLRRSAK